MGYFKLFQTRIPCYGSAPLTVAVLPKSSCLLLICVRVDNQRQPQLLDFFLLQLVQGGLLLQVQVGGSVFYPAKNHLELELDGMSTSSMLTTSISTMDTPTDAGTMVRSRALLAEMGGTPLL